MSKELVKYEKRLNTLATQKTTALTHTIFNTDYSSTPLLQLCSFHELKSQTELKVLKNHLEHLKQNGNKSEMANVLREI
jgi:hypothetical protein